MARFIVDCVCTLAADMPVLGSTECAVCRGSIVTSEEKCTSECDTKLCVNIPVGIWTYV